MKISIEKISVEDTILINFLAVNFINIVISNEQTQGDIWKVSPKKIKYIKEIVYKNISMFIVKVTYLGTSFL